MQIKRKSYICTEKENNLFLTLSNYTHICRYHKWPTRTKYTNNLLAPKGMCIDLFHSAYPSCLSLLYGAKFNEKVIISCPNPDAGICIELTRHPTKTKYLRKFIVRLLSKIGRDIELPDTEIIMTIINDNNAGCLYAYKKGCKFKFNLWSGRELCPATFDAVYPFVNNFVRGSFGAWQKKEDNNAAKVVCPDSKSSITMSIVQEKVHDKE